MVNLFSFVFLFASHYYFASTSRIAFYGNKIYGTKDLPDRHHKLKELVLAVGDSIMNQQYRAILSQETECAYISTYNMFNESKFEKIILDPTKILKKFDIVYLNFAALHMLHLHGAYGKNWTIEYLTSVYFLENFILREVYKYAKISHTVVIQTPPHGCDEALYGRWASMLHNFRNFKFDECVEYVTSSYHEVISFAKKEKVYHGPFPPPWNISDPADALHFCSNYTLTSTGTSAITNRMLNLYKIVIDNMMMANKDESHVTHPSNSTGNENATDIPTRNNSQKIFNFLIYDYNNATRAMGCNKTIDGRHYNMTTIKDRETVPLLSLFHSKLPFIFPE